MRVRYVRTGSGSPLLLVHGLASSIFTWKELLAPLAREHDVVALDLPGFGGSDQPADLSGELYPGVLSALLQRLGLARADVVGHSLGGAASVMLAASRPERVGRLVLLDAAGFNLGAAEMPWLVRAASWPPIGGMLQRLPLRRSLVRLGLRQVFHDDELVNEARVEEYWWPLARPGAIVSLRSLLASREALAGRFPALAARVRAPTLLIWCRQDTWIPLSNAERFLAAIADSRKVVLEDCGHMPQEERPAELLRELRSFLG